MLNDTRQDRKLRRYRTLFVYLLGSITGSGFLLFMFNDIPDQLPTYVIGLVMMGASVVTVNILEN